MEPQFDEKEMLPPRSYRFGEFELDLKEEILCRDGEKLNINHRMFQVLRLLVERRGEIVSKNEFFEKVWDGSFVEDNNLTVTITGLRKALGDDAKHVRFIENIPRKGYRFVADVRSFDRFNGSGPYGSNAEKDNGAPLTSQLKTTDRLPLPETESKSRARFRPGRLVIGITLVFMVAVLAIAAVNRDVLWSSSVPAAKKIDSIAVLPFENTTAEGEYLANGLTDSLIGNLSKLTGARVIDRNSAYQYKDKTADPITAGRELNVRSVLTGKVDQQGDVLIINAVLTDVTTNTEVWRQQFRRRLGDQYATQQEISQAVAQNLQPAATARELTKRPTNDPVAYDLYLRGRHLWNKRTNPEIDKSIEFFRSAVDLDPTFAKAYVGLADAYTLGTFPNLSTEEKNAMIRGYVRKALEIDNNLSEAYAALAVNKCFYDWDLAGTENDYLRSLELDPNNATARHWYAEFLSMQGRFDESLVEYERAMSLDPLSMALKTDMAFSHYYARNYDTAIDLLNKIKERNPDYARTFEFLALAYLEKGMYSEAIDAMEETYARQLQRGEIDTAGYEVRKRFTAGLRNGLKTKGAEGFWNARLKYSENADAFLYASTYTKLGDADNAFAFLEKAFKERSSGMVWLKVMPEFDGIRSDPRYKDLLRRVGL